MWYPVGSSYRGRDTAFGTTLYIQVDSTSGSEIGECSGAIPHWNGPGEDVAVSVRTRTLEGGQLPMTPSLPYTIDGDFSMRSIRI